VPPALLYRITRGSVHCSSVHARRKVIHVLCSTVCSIFCTWKVNGVPTTMEGEGVSPTLLLLCSTAFAWKLEGVSPTLQNRLWMEGGKGVNNCAIQSLHGRWEVCVPYSATPSLYGWWKGCPLLCNTVSGWKVEGVSLALQYPFWMERGRHVNNSAILFLYGRRRCVPCSAIPFSGWKVKGVSPALQYRLCMEGRSGVPYSAIPSLDGRWKVVCHLLCNTVSGWKVEFVSPYSAVLSLHGSWCPLLCPYRFWME
jgi:hypothetical protein